jgi:hypothetical protein
LQIGLQVVRLDIVDVPLTLTGTWLCFVAYYDVADICTCA